MREATIRAHAVSYTIKNRHLVQECSLALEPGKVTVVIGPNGAGKSTLLRLLTGEYKPSAGHVFSLNEPMERVPAWRLACRRAVMTQGIRLAFPFTVFDVARLGIDALGLRPDREKLEAILDKSLAAADVSHLVARDYQTLSGGEQQRVQFARVLCQLEAGRAIEPRQTLFLDEPIASLDLCHQLALLDAACAVAARGDGVLIVLHDLNLAATYADCLVAMKDGRIVTCGTPEDVLQDTLLRDVFDLPLSLRVVPRRGPFLLPHQHRALS